MTKKQLAVIKKAKRLSLIENNGADKEHNGVWLRLDIKGGNAYIRIKDEGYDARRISFKESAEDKLRTLKAVLPWSEIQIQDDYAVIGTNKFYIDTALSLPEFEESAKESISKEQIALLKKIELFTSKDDARYFFSGIYFDDSEHRAVATDGKIIGYSKYDNIPEAIKGKSISDVWKYLDRETQVWNARKEDHLTHAVYIHHIFFNDGVYYVVTQREGRFPGYETALPNRAKYADFSFDKKLLDGIDRTLLISANAQKTAIYNRWDDDAFIELPITLPIPEDRAMTLEIEQWLKILKAMGKKTSIGFDETKKTVHFTDGIVNITAANQLYGYYSATSQEPQEDKKEA